MKMKRIINLIGVSTLTSYYICTAFLVLLGTISGQRIILDFNMYGEATLELLFTVLSIPCVAFFLLDARKAQRR